MASSSSSEDRFRRLYEPYVYLVRDQGRCNSCWALVAARTASALYTVEHNMPLKASPQELIDYVHVKILHKKGKEPDVMGCLTSSTNNGFLYMNKYGVSMEEAYNYQGRRQTSHLPLLTDSTIEPPRYPIEDLSPRLWLRDFVKLLDTTRQALLEAMSVQPIASAIQITPQFRTFTGEGVFDGTYTSEEKKREYEMRVESQKEKGKVPKKKDEVQFHAIMIYGHGRINGAGYCKIENTWGEPWGDGGFAKVQPKLFSESRTSWPRGSELREVRRA